MLLNLQFNSPGARTNSKATTDSLKQAVDMSQIVNLENNVEREDSQQQNYQKLVAAKSKGFTTSFHHRRYRTKN